jgi:hypothetical protein
MFSTGNEKKGFFDFLKVVTKTDDAVKEEAVAET